MSGRAETRRSLVRSLFTRSNILRWVVVAALIGAAVAGMRERELDKLIFSNASSIAFFAVMLVAVTYGLINNWLKVPVLSPWVILFVGGGAWMAGFVMLHRRYS